MNDGDLIPIVLLLLFGLALGGGVTMVGLLVRRNRSLRISCPTAPPGDRRDSFSSAHSLVTSSFLPRPNRWLAIKSRNVPVVQAALGLHNPKPCSWTDGLAGEENLFIAPPVDGWILVIGSGLPDPGADVDAAFRFILSLSRELGEVQFFSFSHFVQHHAWVRAQAGRVLRAYAWAGKTIWKQGCRTAAEKELGLKCFDYTEAPERSAFSPQIALAGNVDKVPLLAARWSLDPATIDAAFLEHQPGISGELSRKY